MRVRVKKLYKITFPIYNRGVQAAIKEGKVIYMAKKANDLAHTKYSLQGTTQVGI